MSSSSSAEHKPSVITGYRVAAAFAAAPTIAYPYRAPPPHVASAYHHANGAPPPPAYYPTADASVSSSSSYAYSLSSSSSSSSVYHRHKSGSFSAPTDPNVARGFEADRGRGDGAVGFDSRVLAWDRFRCGAWGMRLLMMRVYCNDVWIGFDNATANNGKLVTASPHKCVVDV